MTSLKIPQRVEHLLPTNDSRTTPALTTPDDHRLMNSEQAGRTATPVPYAMSRLEQLRRSAKQNLSHSAPSRPPGRSSYSLQALSCALEQLPKQSSDVQNQAMQASVYSKGKNRLEKQFVYKAVRPNQVKISKSNYSLKNFAWLVKYFREGDEMLKRINRMPVHEADQERYAFNKTWKPFFGSRKFEPQNPDLLYKKPVDS